MRLFLFIDKSKPKKLFLHLTVLQLQKETVIKRKKTYNSEDTKEEEGDGGRWQSEGVASPLARRDRDLERGKQIWD